MDTTPVPDTDLTLTKRKKWAVLAPLGLVVGAIVAWLAFGVFGVHTLFIDDKVNEAAPVFASGAGVVVDESPAKPDAPEIVTLLEGGFIDRSHSGEGRAVVLNDGSAQRFVRFEDFETDNGPNLVVWLTSANEDADAGDFDDDFVPLGPLKGNIGPQNYEIPVDVDLDRYNTVVVWCDRFDVAFTAATLS